MWVSTTRDWSARKAAEISAPWPIRPPQTLAGLMGASVEAERRGVKWALVFIKTKTGENSELFLESRHVQGFNSATGQVYISCSVVSLHTISSYTVFTAVPRFRGWFLLKTVSLFSSTGSSPPAFLPFFVGCVCVCVFHWPYMRCLEGLWTVCLCEYAWNVGGCLLLLAGVCEVAAIGGVESRAWDAASPGGRWLFLLFADKRQL